MAFSLRGLSCLLHMHFSLLLVSVSFCVGLWIPYCRQAYSKWFVCVHVCVVGLQWGTEQQGLLTGEMRCKSCYFKKNSYSSQLNWQFRKTVINIERGKGREPDRSPSLTLCSVKCYLDYNIKLGLTWPTLLRLLKEWKIAQRDIFFFCLLARGS